MPLYILRFSLFALFTATSLYAGETELFIYVKTKRGQDTVATDQAHLVQVRNELFQDPYLEPGTVLQLNLFDHFQLGAVLQSSKYNARGNLIWRGSILGQQLGSALFVVTPHGQVTGKINLAGQVIHIKPTTGAQHRISRGRGEQSSEATPLIPENFKLHKTSSPLGDTDIIDLMVVYTVEAAVGAGGYLALLASIDLAVAETNMSFKLSGVKAEVNLVYTRLVNYPESSYLTMLEDLARPDDGIIDGVHASRDANCADLVTMVVESMEYCGLAYQMPEISLEMADYAFSLVSRGCLNTSLSLPHEIGHNMGARHDWYVDSGTDPIVANHGFVNPGSWRTLMSYKDLCDDLGTTCPEIPYWSNPTVVYGGTPTGLPGQTIGLSANNVAGLNKSVATVANFRDSGDCITPGDCGYFRYQARGELSGPGDEQEHPELAGFTSSGLRIRARLWAGPDTDFNLYLVRLSGPDAPVVVASSKGPGTDEGIDDRFISGTYTWLVSSAKGSGSYAICSHWTD